MNKDNELENIKYNIFKEDVEILIPPRKAESDSFEVNGRTNMYKLCLKLVVALVLVSILSVILVYGYFFVIENELRYSTGHSCTPLQPVNKVTVRLAEAENYSCHDNTTCDLLRRRIEEEGDGLRYNFVIGSDMELYIGLGYKCQVHHLDELNIKLITTDLLSNSSLAKGAFRVYHIIDEGLKCGNVLQNYSVTYSCDGDETGCLSAVDYMMGIDDFGRMVHQSFDSMAHHTIHSPTDQTGIILHKAFRWTACGEASHEARNVNVSRSKVVTLDSLPRQSCQPLKPVDHIVIEFQDIPNTFNCTDSSCSNFITYIERQHDGFRYNFVVDENGHLYIGLGFRCCANDTEATSLKIKVIVTGFLRFSDVIDFRILNIIEQGLQCNKISNLFFINIDSASQNILHKSERSMFKYLEHFTELKDFTRDFPSTWRLQDYNHHMDSHLKVIPRDHKMTACSRTRDSFTTMTSTTPTTLVDQTTTTASQTTSGGDYVDYYDCGTDDIYYGDHFIDEY